MRFYVDYDQGHEIKGWVVPDNPVGVSRVYVAVNGQRVAEVPATIRDKNIKSNGWHATGLCVFKITNAEVPDLAKVQRLEIFDTETNILVYRRARKPGLKQGKVLLIDTSINPETKIQEVLFPHFQQCYFGIGRMSDEVLTVLFESPWLTSTFLSGAVIVPRYEGHFGVDGFLTTALVEEPFLEMANRLLWLKARAVAAADPSQSWRLGRLAEAADFAGEFDFTDIRQLKRFFKMMPEAVYRLVYNPLTRQFGTKLPDDPLAPGNSIVAIEILARVGVIGHRDFFEAFVTTVLDRLGIEAPVPASEPASIEALALADRLRGLKIAQELLVFDVAMADAVHNAVSKGWTL